MMRGRTHSTVTMALAAVLLMLPGCSVYRAATSTTIPANADWRQVATDPDRQRLRSWHQAWDAALPKAKAADARTIVADVALFDPDRAQTESMPPPGDYRCRTFKLGARDDRQRDFSAFPAVPCRVTLEEGQVNRLEVLDGMQRPTGLLFPDARHRAIFLGVLVLGDETTPMRYGTDASRDMAGYVERIGDRRWRLVFPTPRFESLLDVVEIVPAS